MSLKTATRLFALTLCVSIQALADPAETGQDLINFVDARFDQNQHIALQIWDYAELGYLEEKSSALLKQTLADEGFSIESGVAGIPTAFLASYGSGQPVIALLAEYDALPGITQTASPVRETIPGKAGGQACGHHLLGTASTSAAIAIKHWLAETGARGTIRLYGTPAEEGGSGKVYMVRDGLFADVDAVLAWHPDDANQVEAKSSLANRSAKFRFHGVSAHAAGAPEKARSALDAVEAFDFMVNLMREHVPQETRIHYVITSGGSTPNVVPDFAEVYYYVRHPSVETLAPIWERVEKAAQAAADGTGTTVDWEFIHGNYPMLPNNTLGALMQSKLEIVGGVSYDQDEQTFAEKLYPTLDSPEFQLGSEMTVMPMTHGINMGSTDVGDISWNVPTIELATATWVPGTPAHSWQAVAAGGTNIGIKGLQVAAKTLALTARELYQHPDVLLAAKQELTKAQGDDFVYQPLLGDRAPPLDYRK